MPPTRVLVDLGAIKCFSIVLINDARLLISIVRQHLFSLLSRIYLTDQSLPRLAVPSLSLESSLMLSIHLCFSLQILLLHHHPSFTPTFLFSITSIRLSLSLLPHQPFRVNSEQRFKSSETLSSFHKNLEAYFWFKVAFPL